MKFKTKILTTVIILSLSITLFFIKKTNFSIIDLDQFKDITQTIPFEQYIEENTTIYLDEPINKSGYDDRVAIEFYVGVAKVDNQEIIKYFYRIPIDSYKRKRVSFVLSNNYGVIIRKNIDTEVEVYGEIEVTSCDTTQKEMNLSYSSYSYSTDNWTQSMSGFDHIRCDYTPISIEVQIDKNNQQNNQ